MVVLIEHCPIVDGYLSFHRLLETKINLPGILPARSLSALIMCRKIVEQKIVQSDQNGFLS
jgi:hypothetical protein